MTHLYFVPTIWRRQLAVRPAETQFLSQCYVWAVFNAIFHRPPDRQIVADVALVGDWQRQLKANREGEFRQDFFLNLVTHSEHRQHSIVPTGQSGLNIGDTVRFLRAKEYLSPQGHQMPILVIELQQTSGRNGLHAVLVKYAFPDFVSATFSGITDNTGEVVNINDDPYQSMESVLVRLQSRPNVESIFKLQAVYYLPK